MRQMDTADQSTELSEHAESKAKKLFWGSLLLSVLVIIHVVYLARRTGGVLATVQTVLPAVLLWSLVMTAYAFHSLCAIARRRSERLTRASTDVNTGVFSLDYLKSSLDHERRRATKTGTSTVVAYVDMVNLERANRNFGHTIGDIVLKAAAQLIATGVRRGDIVGRVGGDEFLVIMPETALEEAASVVTAIREAIEGYRL
ncbi:MAG: GGDEF domain-containing protein, partial [Planctomycetota bacterium]